MSGLSGVVRGRGMRAALVAVVSGSVVLAVSGPAAAVATVATQPEAPAAPVPAAPTPAPSTSPSPATPKPLPRSLSKPGGRQLGPAKKQQIEAFAVETTQVTSARAGGVGIVDFTIPRRGKTGVNASGFVITVPTPAGMTLVKAATEGSHRPAAADPRGSYQCASAPRASIRCTYRGDLSHGHVPAPLRVWMRATSPDFVAASATGRKVHVKATSSWVEDRVAEDHDGESGNDPVVGTRVQRVPSGAFLTVDSPVTISARGHNKGLLWVNPNGDASRRKGNLAGTIGNINGLPVASEWTQVAGPKVTFLEPTKREHATKHTGISYEVPSGIADKTQLTFRLTASGDGWARSTDTTVTVRSLQVGRFDPRMAQMKAALAKSARPKPARKGLTVPRSTYASGIGGRGAHRVGTSGQVVLDFHHDRPIKSVAWTSVTVGAAPLIKAAKRSGNKLIFTAPKKPQNLLVRGVATLADGRKIVRTKLVTVLPRYTPVKHPRKLVKAAEVSAAATAPTGTPADPKSTAMFCGLKGGSVITFADGATLTLPSNYVRPAGCNNTSSQAFTGATFAYSGTTFGNASGTISGNGVTFNNVTFAVPSSLQKYLPSGAANTSLTLTSPASTAVTANFVNGQPQGFSGSFTSNTALSFFPTPSGWSAPAMTATLSNATGAATFTLAVTTSPNDGSGAAASFTAVIANNNANDAVMVSATDIALFQSTGGNQFEGTVNGTFSLSAANTLAVNLTCPNPDPTNGCLLATNMWLGNGATLTWTSGSGGGLALSNAKMTVGSGSSTYTFNISGAYNGTGDWSFQVSDPGSWALGSTGVALTNFNGSISEKPAATSASAAAPSSTFTVDITSQVTGLQLASWLSTPTITGSISNTCPPGMKAPVCTPGNVVVSVATKGAKATVDGTQVPFDVSMLWDLSSMKFALDGTTTYAPTGGFGPSEFNISSLTLTLKGSYNNMSLAFASKGTILGTNTNLSGGFSTAGYYLAGNLPSFSSGGFQAVGGVSFGYSSYDTSVKLPGSKTATKLVAQTITVTGSYALDQNVQSALGLPAGNVTFTSQMNLGTDAFSATIAYNLAQPKILFGNANSTNLTFNGINLTVTAATTGVSFNAAVVGAVNTAASANNAASSTPIAGSIGVTVGGPGGASLEVQVGVDRNVIKKPSDCGGVTAEVCNAFGVNNLDVNTLAVSGGGTAASPQVSFNSDVYLPGAWTSGMLVNNPEVKLGFELSLDNPCVKFTIGHKKSGTQVIDIGGAGLVTGTYLNLLFAPSGCQLPTGTGMTTIKPGLAFNFDGALFGTTTDVNIEAVIQSAGVEMKGNVDIAAFTLAGASVNQTKINFDINTDPANLTYQLGFSGGVSVGDSAVGGTVQAAGDFDITPGQGIYSVSLKGSGDLDLAGIDASLTNFVFAFDYSNGSVQSLDISGDLNISILGVEDLQAGVALSYADGTLTDFHMNLDVGLDLYVGSVNAGVYVDYCDGTLGGEPTNSASCTVNQASETTFEIYVDGSYSIGPCWLACYTKDFSDVIVDTTAQNPGPPALDAALNLANPGNSDQFAVTNAASYDLDLMWDQASFVGNISNAQGELQTVMMTSVAPQPNYTYNGQSFNACPSPNTGVQWSPTAGNANPATNNASPLPSSVTAPCAVQVVWSQLNPTWNSSIGDVVPASEFDAQADGSTNSADIPNLSALATLATNGNSSQAWQAPIAATVVCYPAGTATSQNSSNSLAAAHCEVWNPDSFGSLQTGGSTPDLVAPMQQVLNGTVNPLGVLPGGMTMPIEGETSIWSPDGQSMLQMTNVELLPNSGYNCLDNDCGSVSVMSGQDYPTWGGGSLEFMVEGSQLPARPTSTYVDPGTGQWIVELADGSSHNFFLNGVELSTDDSDGSTVPYLFLEDGLRLWSGNNCAPADWYSQCGSVGQTNAPLALLNGATGSNVNACLNTNSWNDTQQINDPACNGSTAQQVYFDDSAFDADGGRILIGSSNPSSSNGNPGGCVDVERSGNSVGTVIDYFHCNGTAAQTWVYQIDGTIMNPASGLCLDSSGSGGAILNTCNASSQAQQWSRQGAANFSS